MYAVDSVGETETDPDVASPVEKLVPVQLTAFCADQVSVEDWPSTMEVGSTDIVHCGPTAQLAYVYVPESVPFEHVRDCETDAHDCPYGTVDD